MLYRQRCSVVPWVPDMQVENNQGISDLKAVEGVLQLRSPVEDVFTDWARVEPIGNLVFVLVTFKVCGRIM